jgi:hypothetical protein
VTPQGQAAILAAVASPDGSAVCATILKVLAHQHLKFATKSFETRFVFARFSLVF